MSFKHSFWGSLTAYLVGKIVFAVVSILILFAVVGVFISKLDTGDNDISVQITEATYLKIALEGIINDRKNDNPLQVLSNENENSLEEIKKGLSLAEKDALIKGVVLDFSGLSAGIANISELRKMLSDFKKKGKKVFSYGSSYSQADYYLASCANEIFLNPHGNIEFKGLTVKHLYFSSLLQKLGVEPQIFRQGQLNYGTINGTHRLGTGTSYKKHKASYDHYFTGDLFEYTLDLNVNITNLLFNPKHQLRKYYVYGFVGAGLTSFRSVRYQLASDNQDTDPILSYEGYNAKDLANSKVARTNEVVIPMGLGVRYKLNSNWSVTLETSGRYMRSDKLDAFVAGEAKDVYQYTNAGVLYSFSSRIDEPESKSVVEDIARMNELIVP